jgi:CRP-like cAMP-binding protein
MLKIDMKNSFDYLFKDANFPKELEKELEKILSFKKVKKREILLNANNYVTKLFFVVDGCLRSYFLDEEAREHTLHFAVNNAAITDFVALYNKKLSSLYVECITDSVIIEIDFLEYRKTLSKYKELESFQRVVYERHISSLSNRILNQLTLTAVERYKLFLTEFPQVNELASNHHIASYLGVAQQSLSRLKSEI